MQPRLYFIFPLCILMGIAGCITVVDAAAFGWGSKKDYTEDFRKTFSVATPTRVLAETVNGSVAATAWDKPEVELLVVKRVHGVDETDAQKYLDEITVDINDSDKGLEVRVKQPNSHGGINYGANVELRVPKGTALDLDTTNGSVDVSDVGGAVKAETTNGSVTCEGAVRRVEAETTNGHVDVTCNSSNPELEEITAESTNGSVTVSLPASASFELKAETVNGRVANDFGVPVEGMIIDKHAQGKVGNGGPAVNVSTTNGNVDILALNP